MKLLSIDELETDQRHTLQQSPPLAAHPAGKFPRPIRTR